MHCTFQCFWYWTVAARKPTLAQIAGLVNNYANGIHPGRARLRVQLRACRSTTHDEPERTVKLFDRVLNPREIRRRLGRTFYAPDSHEAVPWGFHPNAISGLE